MDQSEGITAAHVVNTYSERSLTDIFWRVINHLYDFLIFLSMEKKDLQQRLLLKSSEPERPPPS